MLKVVLGAAAALMLAAPAYALDVPYSTTGSAFTDLGGNTPGDTLTLTGLAGDFTGPGTYDLNGASFFATHFAVTPDPFVGTFTETATTSLGSFDYAIAYSLQLGSSDTISLGGNAFDEGGYHIVINPLSLTSGIDGTSVGTLTFTVTSASTGVGGVPEPATWGLMIMGFGAMGAALRRRQAAAIAA